MSSAPTSETVSYDSPLLIYGLTYILQEGLPIAINNLNAISNIKIIYVRRYYLPGVLEIIGRSSESFIRVLNESTILKYLYIPNNNESI